jgi:sigma-B regulation protein RsbU (phosphoserine phosphatase)
MRPDVPSLMSTLNDCLLARATASRFVSAFAATLNNAGQLHYCNAGHPAPLWIRRAGEVVELNQGGPLLGVFPRPTYSQAPVQLAPGDLLVLYTDGLTEAHDSQGNPFGTARLLEWARAQRGRSPQEVKDRLVASVRNFCGDLRQNDDRSILVMRYNGLGVPVAAASGDSRW